MNKDKFIIGCDPYAFPVQVRDDLPNNVFYMINGNMIQKVRFEWDDIKKKNKITVTIVK